MPMVGIIDPSQAERNADDQGRYPAWSDRETVLLNAQTGDPKWGPWPYELINAALAEHQERDYISTTMLTGGCARGKVLERRADYIGDVDSMYASLMGTLAHRTLEYKTRPGALAEWRFFTQLEVKGRKVDVSCSPDLLVYENQPGIWDWKKTENPPRNYPWQSHSRQVQYNRFIVNNAERWLDPNGDEGVVPFRPSDLVFEHLVLVYLAPKGPEVMEVKKTRDTLSPNGKTVRRAMPYIMSDEDVLDDMMPRLEGMLLGLDAYPDFPQALTEFPGFAGPPTWACPGKPLCSLPMCLAKRYPDGLLWESS